MTLGEVGWRPNPGKVPLPRPSPASLAGHPAATWPSPSQLLTPPPVSRALPSEGGRAVREEEVWVFLEEAWEQEAERGSERARERGVRGEERGFEK